MKQEIKEELIPIARRIAPGDRWILTDDPKREIIEGLTETLDTYVTTAQDYQGEEFRLAPIRDGGVLYIISEYEEEVVEVPSRQYDLYGERG